MTSPTAPTAPAPAASKRGTSKRAASNGSSRKGHRLQGGTGEANRMAVAILEVLAGLRPPAEAAQSLQISVPRYYVLETRALEGLVAACEPKPLGKQPTPQTRIAALEKELQQARHECARQQALVRVAQRTVGLTLPATRPGKQKAEAAKKGGKRRRRRPTVRALRAAKTLRNEWLQESLELLEPRPLGRPPQVASPEQEEVARLQAENRDLKQQRRVAEVREELAQWLPQVLRPAGDDLKKGTALS